MILTVFIFILGFVLLLKGAHWLVDGATSIGKRLGISTLVIGLTIVAFGMNKGKVIDMPTTVHLYSLPRSALMVIAGLTLLALGGRWIVSGAVDIASMLGVSEAMIALTIIAVGTSLPELATSVVATYKRNTDIAVGNIVGSNIFNIFWILGVTSIIIPLHFSRPLFMDVIVVIVATLLLFLLMFIGKRYVLKRWQGITFILLYIGYIVSLTVRQ